MDGANSMIWKWWCVLSPYFSKLTEMIHSCPHPSRLGVDGWYFASGAALMDRELDKFFGGPNSYRNPMVAGKWCSNSTLVAIVNTLSSSRLKVI